MVVSKNGRSLNRVFGICCACVYLVPLGFPSQK